jgi:uncharacterized repeat protein (TIGR03943 family)
MNRQAQAVVMLLLGGAVLKASVTDMYLRYVKAGLHLFLIGAGVLLILAAVMTLWYDLRGSRESSAHAQEGHEGHAHDDDGHGHHEPRVGWLLILPVLGLLLVAPPALGSYAAGQSGTALSANQQSSDFPPLPDGDPATVSVLDYASRAVFDKGRSLGDRRLKLTGFVSAAPDGTQYLTRMILSCCAADARPIKLGMAGAAPGTGELASDTWIQVVGAYTNQTATDSVNGETIPYIKIETWQQVAAPKQPYE